MWWGSFLSTASAAVVVAALILLVRTFYYSDHGRKLQELWVCTFTSASHTESDPFYRTVLLYKTSTRDVHGSVALSVGSLFQLVGSSRGGHQGLPTTFDLSGFWAPHPIVPLYNRVHLISVLENEFIFIKFISWGLSSKKLWGTYERQEIFSRLVMTTVDKGEVICDDYYVVYKTSVPEPAQRGPVRHSNAGSVYWHKGQTPAH